MRIRNIKEIYAHPNYLIEAKIQVNENSDDHVYFVLGQTGIKKEDLRCYAYQHARMYDQSIYQLNPESIFSNEDIDTVYEKMHKECIRKNLEMDEDILTEKNGDIDDLAYHLMLALLPNEDNSDQFPWNAKYIGEVVEQTKTYMQEKGFKICHMFYTADEEICFRSAERCLHCIKEKSEKKYK